MGARQLPWFFVAEWLMALEKKKAGFGFSGYVAVLLSGSGSEVISSIGFGGGVVSIVQPIHAPMAKIATKATATGVAMSQNRTSAAFPMLKTEAMWGS